MNAHETDFTNQGCKHCGLGKVMWPMDPDCPRVWSAPRAPSATAQHPTAWGLKPIAAASGCDTCFQNRAQQGGPAFIYDGGSAPQMVVGRGPGLNTVVGRVALCTACAALQPQSLVGPAAQQQAYQAISAQQYMNVMQTGILGQFAGVTLDDDVRSPSPVLPEPACDCGAKKTYGAADFTAAHSSWCTVAEGKR